MCGKSDGFANHRQQGRFGSLMGSRKPRIIDGKEDSGAEGIMIDCEPTSCQELFGSVHMYRPFPDLASLTTPGRKNSPI